MPRYSLKETLSRQDEDDYMAAIEIILCEHHNRPTHQRNPDLVLPHVYVGNIGNAENYKLLRKYGITHVLNCAGYKGNRSYQGSPYEGLDIEYKEFMADDSETYDISQHFRESFHYMDKAKRKNGCVLVHCAQGINRSVAVCLAYLMMEKNYSLLKAVKQMQKKRGCVLSNRAFQRQLVMFACENGCLDSRAELEKILPKRKEEPKDYHEPVQNGTWHNDFDTYHKSYHDGFIKKNNYSDRIDKTFAKEKDKNFEINGTTVATGSSIFEDYLRRMKSN